jgi:transcriptional regulator with XRE-family HTH domain
MLSRAHAGNIAIREAALKCGLNYGSWSNWERGGMPRDLLETVRKISDGLGIDDEWLLFGGALAGRSWRDRGRKDQDGIIRQFYPQSKRTIPHVDHPRDTRPNGGPTNTVPPAATRRPVRLGLDHN